MNIEWRMTKFVHLRQLVFVVLLWVSVLPFRSELTIDMRSFHKKFRFRAAHL